MLIKGALCHFLWLIILFFQISCSNREERQSQNIESDSTVTAKRLQSGNETIVLKKLFVLHSYQKENEWVQDINKGIIQGLEEERFFLDKNIGLEYFYLNSHDGEDETTAGESVRKAIQRIQTSKPDIVISADDFASKNIIPAMKPSGIRFIFLGVNGDPVEYGIVKSLSEPDENVTGVLERVRFSHSVKLLRRLIPNVQKVAIVSDRSFGSSLVISRIKEQASLININILAILETDSFTLWKKFVLQQQSNADALVFVGYRTLKNDQGGLLEPQRALYWTLKNSKIPEIGFWPQDVKGGILCSEAISGYQQGYYAATLAAYILMGQSPSDFPVSTPQRGELCLNLSRAKMLNVEIPEDLKQITKNYKMIGSADGLQGK